MEEEEKEEELAKEENKEVIKPVMFVPELDRDGHAVFRFLNKEDAELVATALSPSTGVKGVKLKPAKENTCPLEPEKPYEESVCAKLDELFKKRKEKKRVKEQE